MLKISLVLLFSPGLLDANAAAGAKEPILNIVSDLDWPLRL